MRIRSSVNVVLCAALIGLLMSHEARATSCGRESLTRAMARDLSDVVFDGTVSTVHKVAVGEVVTFEVRQVWKGDVPKQITIHNGAQSGPVKFAFLALFPFEQGQRYVVFAHRMMAEERALFGLGGLLDRFGTGICQDGSRAVDAHILSELSELPSGNPPR